MIEVPVSKGRFVALIDDEDADLVLPHTWTILKVKSKHRVYHYATTKMNNGGKRKTTLMHRVILSAPSDLQVDHKNFDGLDNRKENIRLVTRSDNLRYSRARAWAQSQYRGVARNKNKWRASISIDGKGVHLGMFDDEVDAAKAYDRAVIKAHRDFACLNFPDAHSASIFARKPIVNASER